MQSSLTETEFFDILLDYNTVVCPQRSPCEPLIGISSMNDILLAGGEPDELPRYV